MMKRAVAWLAVMMAVGCCGDIIWLVNGKALEGSAELVGDKVRVVERDGKGEYELSTAIVARVDVGMWLEDLEPAARAEAQRAMRVPTVAGPARALPGEDVLRRRGIRVRDIGWLWGSDAKNKQQVYTLWVGLIGCLFFCGVSIGAFIVTLIHAFKKHIAAGLVVLFVPLAVLVYVCFYYTGRRVRMLLALVSPVAWLVVVWLMLRG